MKKKREMKFLICCRGNSDNPSGPNREPLRYDLPIESLHELPLTKLKEAEGGSHISFTQM